MSRLLARGRYLLSLDSNKGIIQLRKRVKSGSLAAIFLGFYVVPFPQVRLV